MPELLAPAIIAKSGPLILDTFIKHYLDPRRYKEDKDDHDARDDLMYDEAFNIMKTFLVTASNHTANALQKFGMTRTPAPPWVAVHRLHVPHSTLASAADYLVTALGGEEMAYKVAGGIKWWQVRAGPGVESEWICMKKEYRQYQHEEKEWSKQEALHGHHGIEDTGFLPEMDRMRCMLYIHGGAYYWGSINTHRYAIWRFARKMHGRAFAVNYRKAPQYPFPCAIQDCLAAWLYLVKPPPGAPHHAVDPNNIIIAGDSAGGGLVWALLQILRDTPGLDLPAGAVLISPWSDLTHSFPSILQNTKTDVIPPYSFIHKPSSLWPPPRPDLTEEMQSTIASKVKGVVRKHHGSHGHGEHGKTSVASGSAPVQPLKRKSSSQSIHTSDPEAAGKLKELFRKKKEQGEQPANPASVNPAASFALLTDSRACAEGRAASTLSQCTDPLRLTVLGERLAIDNQVQLYATNAQLCHPYVSPILGYLGGLPPIYVLAGDKEVLRDEIIYCAHKAAHPEKYPLREDVKQLLPSLQGIESKHAPTNVHLQVYDGVGHDLPLFSMTTPARGSFRAIASFCRYVTPSKPNASSTGSVPPTPPTGATASGSSISGIDLGIETPARAGVNTPLGLPQFTSSPLVASPALSRPALSRTITDMSLPPAALEEPATADAKRLSQRLEQLKVEEGSTSTGATLTSSSTPTGSSSKRNSLISFLGRPPKSSSSTSQLPPKLQPKPHQSGDDAEPRVDKAPESKAALGTAGHMSVYAGENPFKDGHMIRERVNLTGVLRPLEAEEKLGALAMPFEQIGMIKEGPALRFVEGQALWDHKFKRVRSRIARHRNKNLKRSQEHDSQRILARWETAAAVKEKLRQGGTKKTGAEHRDGGRAAAGVTGTAPATAPAAGVAVGFSASTADATSVEASKGPGHDDETTQQPQTNLSTPAESITSTAAAPSPAIPPSPRPPSVSDSDSGSESDSAAPPPEPGFNFGPTWAWQWALDDEAPPPSAIVSRRDLPEGRNLALMADGLEGESGTVPASASLNFWVLFATFFAASNEPQKATKTLQEAKTLREQQRKQSRKANEAVKERDAEHGAEHGAEQERKEEMVEASKSSTGQKGPSMKVLGKFSHLFGKGA